MTTLDWHTTRDQYANTFGAYPGQKIEAELIEHFEIAPSAVTRILDEISGLHQAGQVTSPWGLAHSRITRAATPVRDATVDTSKNRGKAIAGAEAWIRRTGCQYDTQDAVEGELFGDDFGPGMLQDFKNDGALRNQLLELWRETRPAGQAVETEAEERAAKWREQHTCSKCGQLIPFVLNPHKCKPGAEQPQPETQTLPQPEPAAATTDFWEGT